jgi:hypothetical protein
VISPPKAARFTTSEPIDENISERRWTSAATSCSVARWGRTRAGACVVTPPIISLRPLANRVRWEDGFPPRHQPPFSFGDPLKTAMHGALFGPEPGDATVYSLPDDTRVAVCVAHTDGCQFVVRHVLTGSERRWPEKFYRTGLGRRLTNSVEVDGRRRLTFNGGLTGDSVELLAAARGLQTEHPGEF